MTDFERSHAAGNEHLPDELACRPWSEDSARWRLARLPFAVPSDAEFRGGNSNDAWLFDDEVLRVCWRADRGRLLREAALLYELPATVPHAEVISSGSSENVSWVRSPRLPGKPLEDLLPELSIAETRALFRQFAGIWKALHDWKPSADLARTLSERPRLDLQIPESAWQSDLVPLPIGRIAAIVDVASRVPHVDGALIKAASERIHSLALHDPFTDDAKHASVIHGDATVGNILVEGGRITGLIDFEYARMGPRDLELLSPVLFASAYGLDWLRADYPELFEGSDIRERLWLYELCCASGASSGGHLSMHPRTTHRSPNFAAYSPPRAPGEVTLSLPRPA